jgi:signal transduction histidine kinase/Tfp pilus assembly protein PilF
LQHKKEINLFKQFFLTTFPKIIDSVKLKGLLIVFTVSLFALEAFCQVNMQRVDSLLLLTKSTDIKVKVNAFDGLSRLYWYYSSDSSIYYGQLALHNALKYRDDELIGDAYNTLGNALSIHRKNLESIPYYNKAIEFRQKAGAHLKVAYSYSNIGVSYRNLAMYTESINAFKESIEASKIVDDYANEAYMLMNVGEVYSLINDTNKALEFAIKGASIFIHLNNKSGIAYAYNFIGSLHRILNNTNLALEYFTKAYEIHIQENDIDGLSNSANNLGIVYGELGENAKALEFYNKSLELAIKTNSSSGASAAHNNIGYLYARMKDYPKALESYHQSVRISEEAEDYSGTMNTYNNIAWVHYNTGNINKAHEYVLKALALENRNENLHYKAESYEILSKIFLSKGEYKSAFNYLSEFMAMKDSLFKTSSNEKYMEMQVRFDSERKEKEIEILKKNDEIKNLQLQRQKNLNIIWLLFTVLLVSFGVVIFYNLKSKQKINNLLTEKNLLLEETNTKLIESEKHLKELNATKDRFFSLIAHDLKNPFGALMGFSQLLQDNFESYTREEAEELIKIIYESSQNLFKLLDNLLQWSKSQLGSVLYNPELFPLLSVVNQEVDLLKPIANKKKLKVTIRIEEYMIVFADKNLVAVIIRNLINNAIKFSNTEGRIILAAHEIGNLVEVSVSDSGIGINKDDQDKLFRLDMSFTSKGTADEKGTGLGLLLCKEFVEKNGGTIRVESNKDQGSTFVFTLPALRSTKNA